MSFTAITDRIFSENRENHIINRNSIVVFFIPCVYINTHVHISIFEKWAWWDPVRQMEHVRQYGHRTKTFHGWKILPRALTRTPHFFHCFKGKRKVPPLLPIVYKMETNFYVRLFPENNYTINLPCLLKRNNRFNMVVENV